MARRRSGDGAMAEARKWTPTRSAFVLNRSRTPEGIRTMGSIPSGTWVRVQAGRRLGAMPSLR